MYKSIIFNKSNSKIKLDINPEKPSLVIRKIRVISSIDASLKQLDFLRRIDFKFVSKSFDGSLAQNGYNLTDQITHPERIFEGVETDLNLNSNKQYDYVDIEFTNANSVDVSVELTISNYELLISVDDPFSEFESHFELKHNTKILFSAKFGQGKTTFINHYFDERLDQYEVFRVSPVNYSVASNEDIFRYIKTELIFQLLGKSVDFEKLDFTTLEVLPFYLNKNFLDVFNPLIQLLQSTGHSLGVVLNTLFKLQVEFDKFKENKEKLSIDQEKVLIDFTKEVYQKEGSIFEDNFFTNLIRELIGQFSPKKKTVLIIDDLDRIDPEHVFRILNVLSCHYDVDNHYGTSNKFGFDKIILVCDIDNLRSIYAHKYGMRTEFNGYIHKYYSIGPFIYDNKAAIGAIITRINNYSRGFNSSVMHLLSIILRDFLNTNSITLRELLKLVNSQYFISYRKFINGQNPDSSFIKMERYVQQNDLAFAYFYIIEILSHICDINGLKEKFNRSKNIQYSKNTTQTHVDYFAKLGFAALGSKMDSANGAYKCSYDNNDFTYYLEEKEDPVFSFKSVTKLEKANGQYFKLSESDIHKLFLLNIDKFIEVGGFGKL